MGRGGVRGAQRWPTTPKGTALMSAECVHREQAARPVDKVDRGRRQEPGGKKGRACGPRRAETGRTCMGGIDCEDNGGARNENNKRGPGKTTAAARHAVAHPVHTSTAIHLDYGRRSKVPARILDVGAFPLCAGLKPGCWLPQAITPASYARSQLMACWAVAPGLRFAGGDSHRWAPLRHTENKKNPCKKFSRLRSCSRSYRHGCVARLVHLRKRGATEGCMARPVRCQFFD